jgi:hypothetical protein
MRSNSMPLNNDGDTITLLEGKTVRQIVSYRKQQAGDGKVVKAGKKFFQSLSRRGGSI